MAIIHPGGWRELADHGPAGRRVATLERLALGLPDDYTIYHGLHWSRLEEGQAVFEQVDFVVVAPDGALVLMEQLGGLLEETAEGLQRRQGGRPRLIASGMARSLSGLAQRLTERLGARAPRLEYLLYCPDYRVREPASAGILPERIVDASRREALGAVIQAILPAGPAMPGVRDVHRFLRDVIGLEADVSALVGQAQELVTRISGGLAHWARQLDFEPFRLRVTGSAGSGKTQLALAEYRAAVEAGRRPLYVCYNRPLADHFAAIAPAGGLACTFHHLCERLVREAGGVPDFSQPGAYERLETEAAPLAGRGERFDMLIVDEGQDFPEAWRDLVLSMVESGGRQLWLEDPLQNLYGRPPVPLPGWVGLRAHSNFRSPRPVVSLLRALVPEAAAMEAASPFQGAIECLSFSDPAQERERVKEAVRLCLSAGFRREDLAVITFGGRENAPLLGEDRLGPHTLRRFSGQYDLLGQPLYTVGDVLVESVYRFKGQAAPAVIFTGIDFTVLDQKVRRKLLVGATRAMMKLVLVASPRALQVLAPHLG